MKKFVLLCHAVEGIVLAPSGDDAVGNYLESFDVEAHGGRGLACFTPHSHEALRFESTAAAMECWRTQSKTRPLREDGKPNRPLTAFTMSVEPVSEFDLFWCAQFEFCAEDHCAADDLDQCEPCRIFAWEKATEHAKKM